MFSKLFSIISAPFRAIYTIIVTIVCFITNLIKAPFRFIGYIFTTPKRIFNQLLRSNHMSTFDYPQWDEELIKNHCRSCSSIRNILSAIVDIPNRILYFYRNR